MGWSRSCPSECRWAGSRTSSYDGPSTTGSRASVASGSTSASVRRSNRSTGPSSCASFPSSPITSPSRRRSAASSGRSTTTCAPLTRPRPRLPSGRPRRGSRARSSSGSPTRASARESRSSSVTCSSKPVECRSPKRSWLQAWTPQPTWKNAGLRRTHWFAVHSHGCSPIRRSDRRRLCQSRRRRSGHSNSSVTPSALPWPSGCSALRSHAKVAPRRASRQSSGRSFTRRPREMRGSDDRSSGLSATGSATARHLSGRPSTASKSSGP